MVAICGLIAENGSSIGIFGNATQNEQKLRMKKVIDGILKLLNKILG